MDLEISPRNLKKGALGGVIFGCNNHMIKECLSKQLFGLPASHFPYVRNIQQGLPLFLFNYDNRKLLGIYEAAGSGQMNIDPYAWTNGGLQKTKFPAQVHVRVRLECQPISEYQFKNILEKNYYAPTKFTFEVDLVQVDALILLFTKCTTRNVLPVILPRNASQKVDGTKCKTGHGDEYNSQLPATNIVRMPSSSSLCKTDHGHEKSFESKVYSKNERLLSALPSRILYGCGSMDVSESDFTTRDNDNIKSDSFLDSHVVRAHDVRASATEQSPMEAEKVLSRSEINQFITKLKENFEKLERLTLDQGHQISILEQKQVQADMEIINLKKRVKELEFQLVTTSKGVDNLPSCLSEDQSTLDNPSQCLLDHNVTINFVERVEEREAKLVITSETVDKPKLCSPVDESILGDLLDPNQAIYLVGGFDGSSWLSRLDLYMPQSGSILPLQSMGSPRSYAGVASLQHHVYAIGGGDGCSWYDTVECYDPCSKEWLKCPSLSCEKGCLSAVALEGKIFILGGFNGTDSFSDVEMYDPILGRWIIIGSMLHERFSHAAAELGGSLYVVGGYDGKGYLRSTERHDPREVSWEKLECMSSRRGCHSLVVLNEKLYALGGYDGTNFLSSVEMFDPRMRSWVTTDPMNTPRGYGAAVTLGDSIYIIGGFKSEGQAITDTIECFKEGVGWQVADSTDIGRRCLHSATIL